MKQNTKNLIFIILVIILISFASFSIITSNAISSTTRHLRYRLPTIVYITQDFDKLEEIGFNYYDYMTGNFEIFIEPVTKEIIYEIASLEYVRDFEFFLNNGVLSFDLERYLPDFIGNLGIRGGQNTISLIGVSKPNILQIETGIWNLVAGRMFNEEEMKPNETSPYAPILISSGVALLNNLDIGSIITLYIPYFDLLYSFDIPPGGFVDLTDYEFWTHPYNQQNFMPFEFEVIGLFEIPHEITDDRDIYALHQYAVNQFFTSAWRSIEMNKVNLSNFSRWIYVFNLDFEDHLIHMQASLESLTARWILYDLEDLQPFKEIANSILPDFLMIGDMSFLHRHVTNSLQNVQRIINQILLFTIVASIIVLSLIVLLFLSDRKKEIGIYLSLGEKKIKIILQILFETICLAILGIILSIYITNFFSEEISNSLLLSSYATSVNLCPPDYCLESRSELMLSGFADREININDMLEIFDVSLKLQTISTIFLSSIGIVAISVLVPIIYVLELNPKEILLQSKIE